MYIIDNTAKIVKKQLMNYAAYNINITAVKMGRRIKL